MPRSKPSAPSRKRTLEELSGETSTPAISGANAAAELIEAAEIDAVLTRINTKKSQAIEHDSSSTRLNIMTSGADFEIIVRRFRHE